ncbi:MULTISPECIES: hypothetical protein [Pseudoalteromonas]|uniref:DUF3649 domain-containing protein n=1 Tax=Pseudoalteromonas rubra TaxID=43658 RepID=A0A0L0EWY8_9GAMM|nr:MULTISPECIES: hypothetical protein [Pseudoalteromonas]KAF7781111.1 hypothetical protein PRUB_b0227 [Pseudoalteromonas rubra]KNC68929.1 hypothetical protein AC626_01830 [Pseudoalteromonas rubra]MCG7561443.1 hypothetical protein [Pseudoalteromonas sp. McH1-42]MDK1310208.1 hypothetical protein [Pseudoalteromonas sp. R96]MEC4088028.1 hypothetical protein [Pseudoalteromonas rubra]
MWPKTLSGLFIGLFLSISVVLNLNLLLPFSEGTRLLIGLILAFPIWAAALVWAYSFPSAWKSFRALMLALVPSVLLNTALMVLR